MKSFRFGLVIGLVAAPCAAALRWIGDVAREADFVYDINHTNSRDELMALLRAHNIEER